jgi:putative FmdB family regulatory protein
MPTYEYRCEACGSELEIFHSITEPARRKCPKCGRLRLVRKISAGAGVVFKGGGFYQTDYRSESYKKGEKAERSAAEPAPATPAEPKKPKDKGKGKGQEKKPAD